MSNIDSSMEPMLDMFIFESNTLLEQLDDIMLGIEKTKEFTKDNIGEIFRIMHTIKGSSAMMGIDSVSSIAHSVEDMFFIIREDLTKAGDSDTIFDLVFKASDFMRSEIEKIQNGQPADGDHTQLHEDIKSYTAVLKSGAAAAPAAQKPTQAKAEDNKPAAASGNASALPEGYISIKLFFEDGCQMENLRAYMLMNKIRDYCEDLFYVPADIETNPATAEKIIQDGFVFTFKCYSTPDEVFKTVQSSLNIKSFEVIGGAEKPAQAQKADSSKQDVQNQQNEADTAASASEISKNDSINNSIQQFKNTKQPNLISVNLLKLDELMDLVGEIVITESMVTSSPDLAGLSLDNFQKAARQLRKLTDELQDIVMSIRMVPVSGSFNKMHRIVRDMSKKLGKEAELVLIGEETEVDKTIIDSLADPLMHLVRNAMDHAIEMPEERIKAGKNPQGTITLSAVNTGGEVIISVIDDGAGLNAKKILEKAKKNGMLTKPEAEYTEKEIFNLVMLPGFSTKEQVTEFSGRGVGMDVVKKNIEKVGGFVSVESKKGVGTTFSIKIPLTLAIVDGMEISVGSSVYTLPINNIRECFKVQPSQIIKDTENSEMIMLRGECYPIIRLHEIYNVETEVKELKDGIIIVVESEEKAACLFADKLIGEQQVVVKPLPIYLNKYNIKDSGIAGCTILGNGSISLILDVQNILATF